MGAAELAAADPPLGLLPPTGDGFETGDWRNFRPHYIGTASDWIRPRFEINSESPIDGGHSLRWVGGDRDHEWVMLTNAFPMPLPVEVSVDFRYGGDGGFTAGLVLMDAKDERAGITVSPAEAAFSFLGVAAEAKPAKPVSFEAGTVYQLRVSLSEDNRIRASVGERDGGRVLASFEAIAVLEPGAFALLVATPAGSDAVVDFDNVAVDAGEYLVPSGEWVRSPRFVVLPRIPDVSQDQGNWVGGQSTMVVDGEHLMWYRIRDNQIRGRGYGFARSRDGIEWTKHDGNPIFTVPERHPSNEKISVLRVDGLFRAWYAVDDPPRGWFTAHATSKDGVHWDQHGIVIDESYCKDVVVIHEGGLYYLYSIKDDDKIGVYTSEDGVRFEHRNTIERGVHAHIAAFRERRTGLFHLFSTGGYNGVQHAVSEDGIHFGLFRRVWGPPAAGLDDWVNAGTTYFSFQTDEAGQIEDARSMAAYYQARNEWGNNIPNWNFHGGERVVMAGWFEGLHLGIPTRIQPSGKLLYEAFPYAVTRVEGVEMAVSRPVRLALRNWDSAGSVLGSGTVEALSDSPGRTQWQLRVEGLEPGERIVLAVDGSRVAMARAASDGAAILTTTISQGSEMPFEVARDPG